MHHDKQEALTLINALPDDCSLEEIQYHLYVRSKVQRGLDAIEQGRVVSHDEVEARLEQWLSGGPAW